MNDKEKTTPVRPAAKAERERRLAEALRANLKRRKAATRPLDSAKTEPPRPRESDLE
jgi:hypothetical protein